MKFRRDWTARALALVALAVAIGGGTAFAAGRYLITSTKQIKPSVLKALRRAGPTGPQGLQGPQGPKGTNGTNGINGINGTNGTNGINGTNGAVAAYFGSAAVIFGTDPVQTIVTKSLPAGSYVVHATASVQANKVSSSASNTGVAVTCVLGYPGASQSHSLTSPWASNDDDYAFGTISFDAAATLSSAGSVTLSCTNYSGTNGAQDPGVNADVRVDGYVSATQVNSLS